ASGSTATVYATGLTHVSAFAFDTRGRLWGTTSRATSHTRDGVYLIARRGVRPVEVVRALQGPLGLTWAGGTLFVASLVRVAAYGGVAVVGGAAIVAEWQRGVVIRVDLKTHAVTTFVTGIGNPLPVATAPDGSVLVGDWTTGRIYRIARR